MTSDHRAWDLSAFSLHILAMSFMLCDHIWATLVPSNLWMTCIGRMAFPIFAFLLAEGAHYTRDKKRYARRLLLFALLSEVPFDLIYSGAPFDPFHQNVIWTLLLSLLCIWCIDSARQKGHPWRFGLVLAAVMAAGWLAGTLLMVDYFGAGVLTAVIFFLFRGRSWWQLAGQAVGLWWLNCVLLGGMYFPVTLFGVSLEVPQQAFALLALPLIWLYRGRQGRHSRAFQLLCYAFYPLHLVVLWLLTDRLL